MTARLCILSGCERPVRLHGFCPRHWRRWRLYGDPLAYAPSKVKRIPTDAEIVAEMQAALDRLREAVGG
ncbi:hypothetical protein [Nocardioides sp. HB32]